MKRNALPLSLSARLSVLLASSALGAVACSSNSNDSDTGADGVTSTTPTSTTPSVQSTGTPAVASTPAQPTTTTANPPPTKPVATPPAASPMNPTPVPTTMTSTPPGGTGTGSMPTTPTPASSPAGEGGGGSTPPGPGSSAPMGTGGGSDTPMGTGGGSDTPDGMGGMPDLGMGGGAAMPSSDEDVNPMPSDFTCIGDWQKVQGFRITNLLGHTDEAVAVAMKGDGDYPVGTLIQHLPTEAMVKHKAGFSADTRDWEFFQLSVANDGTVTITNHGATNVMTMGNTCASCHSEAPAKYDFVLNNYQFYDMVKLDFDFMDDFLQMQIDADPRCK
ncbi:MAG TPA: hypothetical protein VHM70_10660 [Polyangiaceae bacterium]|nr:hypothetical protein [Polyangiaceae bacterium]